MCGKSLGSTKFCNPFFYFSSICSFLSFSLTRSLFRSLCRLFDLYSWRWKNKRPLKMTHQQFLSFSVIWMWMRKIGAMRTLFYREIASFFHSKWKSFLMVGLGIAFSFHVKITDIVRYSYQVPDHYLYILIELQNYQQPKKTIMKLNLLSYTFPYLYYSLSVREILFFQSKWILFLSTYTTYWHSVNEFVL